MLDQSHKKEEILLSILDYLKRNGYKQSFEKLYNKTNYKYIEQNNKKVEDLIKSDKISELITYIKNNIQIQNEEKFYYIKILKIKHYIKLVLNNCINHLEQKDSLDYLRTEITPLLNQDMTSTELINSLTYILFIKDESILKDYIQNFLLSYNDDNFIINQICKKHIIPLESMYDYYKGSLKNININFDNYSILNINDNCLTPFKSSEIWFLEISKNKNYICAGFANSNISIFNIKKENKNNKAEILIKLFITISANEQNKRDEITSINFSNDEKYILVGLSNYYLKLFDISNGKKLKEYQNIHSNKITSIIPFPNSNNKFITGGIDKKINILDISNINNINSKEEYTELGNFCRIRQLCYSELLNYIIIISASNTDIIIYNLFSKKIEFKIITSNGSQNVYANISKKDKGKYLIYSSSNPKTNSKIILYDLSTKLVEEKFIGFSQKYMIIKCCFCGPEDKYILSGSEDFFIYLWERGFGDSPKYKFPGHFGIVNTIDMWGNDFIISGSDDKTIKVWYNKDENLQIKFEKNKENKCVIKENEIDKKFLEAMNDDNGNTDMDLLFFPRTPLYFRNNLDDIRMDVDDQDEEQNEDNENEFEEEDYSGDVI